MAPNKFQYQIIWQLTAHQRFSRYTICRQNSFIEGIPSKNHHRLVLNLCSYTTSWIVYISSSFVFTLGENNGVGASLTRVNWGMSTPNRPKGCDPLLQTDISITEASAWSTGVTTHRMWQMVCHSGADNSNVYIYLGQNNVIHFQNSNTKYFF